MAEATGIFINFNIEEIQLKKLLNHKWEKISFGKKIGYYFSELLYQSATNKSVFIFHYEAKTNSCFIAYLVNQYDKTLFEPFESLLQIISTVKQENTTEYAIVATTFPEVLTAYQINVNEIKTLSAKEVPAEAITHLFNKFWSFSDNNSFPEPDKAIHKRNYFYKNFIAYYKKYLSYLEEIERPKKIAAATQSNPYHLFDKFYSYDNKVFEFRTFTNQVIEIPKADPLTFRNVSGIFADKNTVFLSRLAPHSPPNINPKNGKGNNPNAIWEYYAVQEVDGNSFNYIKEKWDTVYWKDKNTIYILQDKMLKKVQEADPTSFEYLDFCFGKDQHHVFHLDQKLPIQPSNYTLNSYGFIYDDQTIWYYENQIPLDAKTFKVEKQIANKNVFQKTFLLSDKNGEYEYNRDWKESLVKK